MFVKNKKIAELEKRIEELETRFNEVFRTRDGEIPSPAQPDNESEALTIEQITDEWLNGKKEGGK